MQGARWNAGNVDVRDGDDGVGAREQLSVGVRPFTAINGVAHRCRSTVALASVHDELDRRVSGESFFEIRVQVGIPTGQDEQMTDHHHTSLNALYQAAIALCSGSGFDARLVNTREMERVSAQLLDTAARSVNLSEVERGGGDAGAGGPLRARLGS